MNIKKLILTAASMVLIAGALTACGKIKNETITVISREEGSGTRGAFIELMKIQEKDATGKKTDLTSKETIIAPGTDVVLTQVSGNEGAIGYISLGSVNDKIKALKIDGVEATIANVKSGAYKIQRPFNIATKGSVSGVSKDFMDYILSKEGQAVLAKSCVAINDNAPAYSGTKPSGKVVIDGSTSVGPVMEKLVEAYKVLNPNATVEVQQSDSTSGMTAAINGTCNIGMSSRELTDTEKKTLTQTTIALDGIAVIVNKDCSVSDISSENVKKIYKGEITSWADVK